MTDNNSTYLYIPIDRLFDVFYPTYMYVDILMVIQLLKHFTFHKKIGKVRMNVV